MNDTHRHKFRLVYDGPKCSKCYYSVTIGVAKCICGEQIGPTEIECRLNAVECLNAEDARGAFSENGWVKVEAYAKALEDKG